RISTSARDSIGSACRIVTVSSTSECDTVRDFAPYQRCRVTNSISDRSSISLHLLFLPKLEPEESARRERQEVGELPDRREDRSQDRLEEELGPVGAREAPVPVARPRHRDPHPVAVAEGDVVTHADLVPVIEHR